MLGHVMVQQHSDGHHGRRSGRHRGIHQDHLVVLDVLGQAEIIQLRLPGVLVGLNENLANPDILAHLRQGLFHCLTRSQDRDSRNEN